MHHPMSCDGQTNPSSEPRFTFCTSGGTENEKILANLLHLNVHQLFDADTDATRICTGVTAD